MPPSPQRLDNWLVQQKIVPTRSQAKRLIAQGQVMVAGQTITKAGFWLKKNQVPEIVQKLKYVSQGGDKLETALKAMNINPQGSYCLDVGACTGGFTDCLLQHGAKQVITLDVGEGQLSPKLIQDSRVINLEKTDIRKIKPPEEWPKRDLIVVDVSFISLAKVLPSLRPWLANQGQVIALFKPQFELDPVTMKRFGGIVSDLKVELQALERFEGWLRTNDWQLLGQSKAPRLGLKKNQEYLLLFQPSSM